MIYRKTFRFQDADIRGEFIQQLEKARDWLMDYKNKHNNLFVCGTTGCGKTYLAMAFLNELAKNAPYYDDNPKIKPYWILSGVEYINSQDLFSTIKQQFSRDTDDSQNAKEYVHKIKNCNLLIIDEFGIAYDTEAERMELLSLLDHRWKNGLPTVFLSNLNISGLMQYLKDRAAQRAFDSAQYVEIKTVSRRSQPQEL